MAKKKYYTFRGVGLNKKEKNEAKKLFKDYRDNYNIDSVSDLTLLEELVYREIRQDRMKRAIEDFEAGKTKSRPKYVEEELDENLQQILNLKEKLGLFEERQKEDPYEYLKTLEKKFEQHRKNNAGDYSLPCPHCSKMIFLMFNVKNYKAKKHPFFPKGKFIDNPYLINLFKEGKLTKKDIANIFGTSKDYINWLIKHWYKNEKK